MFQKKITLNKLVSYILAIADNDNKIECIKVVNAPAGPTLPSSSFNSTKALINNKFTCLKPNDTHLITDLPPKLKSYFDPFINEITRHGNPTFELNENISLYYCILSSVSEKFQTSTTEIQFNYIKTLREKLILFISNVQTFKMNNYNTLGWTKKDVITYLSQFKTNKIILKLLADYFSINIFVLNIIEDKIFSISDNESYDMFRLNIFLTLNGDTFELLSHNNKKIFDHTTSIVNRIISIYKPIILTFNIDLNNDLTHAFTIKLDNLNKYINNENEYDEIVPAESDANAYVKDVETNNLIDAKQVGVVFTVSQKMKLDELQEIAKKFNIAVEKEAKTGKTKQKTKQELIQEINNIMMHPKGGAS